MMEGEEITIDIHVDSDQFSLDVLGEANGRNRRDALLNAIMGLASITEEIAIMIETLKAEYTKETNLLN